jgi:hypothetical protein
VKRWETKDHVNGNRAYSLFFLEKRIFFQIVKKFPVFYRTGRHIIALTKACH